MCDIIVTPITAHTNICSLCKPVYQKLPAKWRVATELLLKLKQCELTIAQFQQKALCPDLFIRQKQSYQASLSVHFADGDDETIMRCQLIAHHAFDALYKAKL